MKGLEEQLKAIAAKRNDKQHIEIHLKGLVSRLTELESELRTCHVDLDDLENHLPEEDQTTLTKLFSRVLGSKEQNRERERQTYLLTFLKCKNFEDLIQEKKFEISILEKKLSSYVGVEDMYHKLLHEKKQQLKYKHKDLVNEIVLLETAIRHQQYQQKEIDEARHIGLELEQHLVLFYDALIEIASLDYFAYSETIDGQIKYSVGFKKAKEARTLQQSVQIISRLCDKFIDELNDVNVRFDLDYTPFVPRIEAFLEQFYDGFISDWIRRKGLKECRNHLDTTLEKVRRILDMLMSDDARSKQLLQENERALETLILDKDIYG